MGGPSELVAAVDAAERAFAALLGVLRSGVDPQRKVSESWTVRDVACHVASSMPAYLRIAAGEGSPLTALDQIDEWNAANLGTLDLDLAELTDLIDEGSTSLFRQMRAAATDPEVTWHAGMPLPLSAIAAVLVPEGYLHGGDVAQACGRPWTIPPADARTALGAIFPLLPSFVDAEGARGVRARIEVRLRGDQRRWLLSFDDGTLHVGEPDGRRADCTVLAHAVPFLLVSYGRRSPLRAAAGGGVLAWGRRPWLGLQLPGFLDNP